MIAATAGTVVGRASPTAAHGTGSATPTLKAKERAFAPADASGARLLNRKASTMAGEVTITQADRIAAAELLGGAAPDGLLEGLQDSLSLVRTLARHRLAHTASTREGEEDVVRAAEDALDRYVADGFRMSDDERIGFKAGYRIAASLSPRPLPTREEVAPHVFLDCDGVLADFDTYAEAYFGMNPRAYEKQVGSAKFWEQLEAKGDFYRNLPLMPDAMTLFEGVKHLHPTILTGCPRGNWAQGQKVAWAAEHFPGVPIITCRSADKRDYAKPGDVLIDDWPQHRHRWIEMGGVFIVHHDAASSLAALWAHYPALLTREVQS